MHSMNTVTSMLDTVIKASRAAESATDTLSNVTSQIIPFFNALHQEVEDMEKRLSEVQAELGEKENTIADLKSKVAEYETTIAQKDELLSKYKTDSEKGCRQSYELSCEVTELKESINKKDAFIAQLKQQIIDLQAHKPDNRKHRKNASVSESK